MKSQLLEILFFVAFVCIVTNGKGQVRTIDGNDTTNVYSIAFREFENYVEKYFPNVKDFIVEESIVSKTWIYPTSKKFKTRILPMSAVPSEFKKRKGVMYYTRIVPLRFGGDCFFVNIIPFRVSRRKNNTELINSGTVTIKFKFDCNSNQLVLAGLEGGLSDLQ